MAYLKSQRREFEKNRSDSSQILVAEQALTVYTPENGIFRFRWMPPMLKLSEIGFGPARAVEGQKRRRS